MLAFLSAGDLGPEGAGIEAGEALVESFGVGDLAAVGLDRWLGRPFARGDDGTDGGEGGDHRYEQRPASQATRHTTSRVGPPAAREEQYGRRALAGG